jgi:RNA polymerase sigma factor (sigma-70 family)
MTIEGSRPSWLDGLKAGHSAAAERLWQAYHAKLIRVARARLRGAPRRAADEEDIVISAFDSFYRAVKEKRFQRLDDHRDLWQLLVMITARKAINQRKHLARKKRGAGRVRGESTLANGSRIDRGLDQIVGKDPTPQFAAQVVEEFRRLLDCFDDDTVRLVAYWKFEGRTNTEIADHLDCSLRSVERKLRLIRARLADEAGP